MSSILRAIPLCLSLFLPFSLAAQFPNILLDTAVPGEYPPCEPSIAINLSDTDNIVGAAILDKAYVTKDGGKSWETVRLTSPYGVFGDPCVVSDSKGNFYYFHLADPSGKGRSEEGWLDRIVSQKSVDGGLSWDEGTFMGHHPPKDQDKEWAAVDLRNDHIYATWTQFDNYGDTSPDCQSNILFARSKNRNKKWQFSKPINQKSGDCIDDDDTTEGAVPTIGPKGEVYVSWALRDTLFFNRPRIVDLKQVDCRLAFSSNEIFTGDDMGKFEEFRVGQISISNERAVSCIPMVLEIEAYLMYNRDHLLLSHTIAGEEIAGWLQIE